MFFAIVSSDLNTADHNIPTLYNEAMQVQGTVADVQGLGQNPPQQVLDFFNNLGVPLDDATRRSGPGSATRAPPSTAATPTS